MQHKYNNYIWQAKKGTFPKNFSNWAWTNKEGLTVAHIAARYGHLMDSFSDWSMENDGWTVAHEAAKFGHLPADFSQWELPDKHGDTVAYIALTSDMLPISFNKWSALINSAGEQTLLELLSKRVSLRYYNCNIMTFQSIWRTEKPLCKTDEDWVIFKKVLPEVYSKYSALDCFDVAQDELFDML